ncbi:MAG: TetR/AcrR family transcriptional regulator [Actinobacteria bacterium]|nr:TetR/AcrR family transcriptional regulator [Actinomycetota bacterium]
MTRRVRTDRRPELLDAATEAIRRHGPSASMTQIATQAGITKPILYRHFDDRDGLVHALAERFSADLMAELQRALQSSDDPRQLIVGTIDTYVAFIERDPDIYRFLVRHVTGDTDLLGFMRQVGQQVAVVVGEQLRNAGQDSGGAEPIAHGIVGMVHAAGDWWLDSRSMPRTRLVDYLAELLWTGASGFILTESRA